MTTPQEQRRIRLKNDYKEMENIRSSIVQWNPVNGEIPYIEEYILTINVRTIIDSAPSYRNQHIVRVSLPATYPLQSSPQIVMVTSPQPYHPNWYNDQRFCPGVWDVSEGLGHHIIRMMRTLQFDPEITNPKSPANKQANDWYIRNQNKNFFPCDFQTLPDPTMERFEIKSIKKTFLITS